MVIKKDRKGLVSLSALTDEEKRIFIKFLEFERERHQEDIDGINGSIAYLRTGLRGK